MTGEIRRCGEWREQHDRPVYTLGERCPDCEGPTEPAGPAPFDPADPYGKYRRALKRRVRE